MEVKTDYKQTQYGPLAADWPLVPLWKFSSFITKGSTPTTYGYDWQSDGVRFLRSECVAEHGLDLKESMFISKEAHSMLDRSEVRSGDLLMTITGNVGRAVLLDKDFGTGNINQHIARIRITDSRLNKRFALHFLSQRRVREYYESITTGQAYPQISLKQVRETEIPLPPLPEQRAIAGALSDVDALIERLDALIAKKRAIKTATMQRLLTGKQRLPGFDGAWTTKRLGEVTQIVNGGTPSSSVDAYWGGKIPWCTPTDITNTSGRFISETDRYITEEGLANSSAALLPEGSLLLCSRATVGEVKISATPISTNQGFKSLICGPDTSNEYLYYLLLTMKADLEEVSSGSTFLELSKRSAAALEIMLPALDEQQAIATILSDMDAEIEALEARREKTEDIKQGMMQELLTGRTRLV